MVSVKKHYENHLAKYYSWICGGAVVKIEENRKFFREHTIYPTRSGVALDLGAGCGFQSIPLAELGFKVLAIDLSSKLLTELKKNKKKLPIEVVCDDLLHFTDHCPKNIELCVCMGDTLTHLNTFKAVQKLFFEVYNALEGRGRLILTFRDLTLKLKDLDRFIPVRSDANTIITCFLEYEKDAVKVHDIIYEKKENQWDLKKSFYRKLRISPKWARDYLQAIGYKIEIDEDKNGMVTIIAQKD